VVALTIAPKPVALAGSIFTNSFGMVFRRIEGLTNFGRKPVYVGVYEVTRGEYARVTRKGTNTSDRLPVTEVSGNAALDFCQSLNQADKLILPGHHYGLPNVEQWLEFAGDTSDWTNAVISQPGPAVVGSKGTNRYGLYDVLGNVFEWCRQGADTVAYGGSYDDQFGPRVLRLGLFSSAGGAPDIGFRCVLAPE
jgi:formylglycine-generating enzyme required for sulfatase activity